MALPLSINVRVYKPLTFVLHQVGVSMYIHALPQFLEFSSELNAQLTAAKVAVSMATPLMAYHMFDCEYHFTDDDEQIPTAGALVVGDKNLIMINRSFWVSTLANHKQRAFVILHEISHIYQHHQDRASSFAYNHELYNIAADYNINPNALGRYRDANGLVQTSTKFGVHIEEPTNFKILYKEKYIGLSADEIYFQLLKENDDDAQKAIENNGGGEYASSDVPSPMDRVATNPVETKALAKNKKTSAAAIAKNDADKTIGDSEQDFVNQIREMFKPLVDWRDILTDLTKSSHKIHPTYNRLSRRSTGDIHMPSMFGERLRMVYGVDSSGSMGHDDYKNAGGELKGIIDQYDGWEMDFISCDTKAHLIGSYSSDDGDDFSSIDLNLIGGGGTSMSPIVQYAYDLIDQGEEIDICIIVSDGFIPTIEVDESYDINIVLIVTVNGNHSYKQDNIHVLQMKDLG